MPALLPFSESSVSLRPAFFSRARSVGAERADHGLLLPEATLVVDHDVGEPALRGGRVHPPTMAACGAGFGCAIPHAARIRRQGLGQQGLRDVAGVGTRVTADLHPAEQVLAVTGRRATKA